MKISIDFDGTMWSHMAFFRAFMYTMKAEGHQVGCLTAHEPETRAADIASMKAHGFPEPDFWYGNECENQETKYWDKAKVILREGIDIHFDDCNDGASLEEYRKNLGDQSYRLIIVEARKPLNVHYE